MMDQQFKKSTPMLLLERLYRKPIRQIVADACAKHERLEGAAAELGVSLVTLGKWRKQFELDSSEPAGVA